MGASGTSTIDFGASPGTQRAIVTVSSGVGAIAPSSLVEAFFMSTTSADHSDYEHQMAAMVAKFTCGNIVAATSFDAICVSLIMMRGVWTFYWVWN